MTGPQVFRVALDMPLRRLFDYLAPEAGPAGDHRTVDPLVTGAPGAPLAEDADVADLFVSPASPSRASSEAEALATFARHPPTSDTPVLPVGTIRPGMRVRVPFGRQRLVGVVMEVADSSELPADRLKSILEVLDPQPILDAPALGLLQWAAEYYHHPIGEVISAAMP